MSKFILTFLFASMASAQAPKLVRLADLSEEHHKMTTAYSAQRVVDRIKSATRLRHLWARVEMQSKQPLCSHWSVPHAVTRVNFLMSYDNFETDEQEQEELLDLKRQLDENGCCAFLPESRYYRVRD